MIVSPEISAGPEFFQFDAQESLPQNWQAEVVEYAAKYARAISYRTNHSTSREGLDRTVDGWTVDTRAVWDELPWLVELYQGPFLEFGRSIHNDLVPAEDEELAFNVNRQFEWRGEAHVDDNPMQGLLGLEQYRPGDGGETVFGRNPAAHSKGEINEDAEHLYLEPGILYLFNGRLWPHYGNGLRGLALRRARKLNQPRITIGFNYFRTRIGDREADRMPDLGEHLRGFTRIET
jgi:hypothetical protein